MSNPIADPGHGHSPAAWTAVVTMLVAFAAGTVFFVLDMPIAVVVCAVLLLLGWIAGGVLAKLGWGVRGPKYVAKQH